MAAQKGSHIKLVRHISGAKQTLTIPNHQELAKGTVLAIYKQILKYIPEENIRNYFYIE